MPNGRAPSRASFLKGNSPFEASSGVTVNFSGKGSNMDCIGGGGRRQTPDVAVCSRTPGPADTGEESDNLGPVLGSAASNYSSAWNALGTVNGKLYGVWYKAANKNTVWYSPAEFAEVRHQVHADDLAAGLRSPTPGR